MLRRKLGLLGLCAMVLGVMAISASSAQAAFDWLVLNAAGTAVTLVQKEGEKVNLLAEVKGSKDTEHLTLLTKLVGLMVSVTCTNFNLVNVNLEPEGKLSLGKVKFTGCAVYNGAPPLGGEKLECVVTTPGSEPGVVETENATSELVLHELENKTKDVLLKIVPDNAENKFAQLEFKNCALPEKNAVKGSVFLKDCQGFATTHKVKHLIEQGPLTSLTVGADTVEHLETSLIGSAWAELGGAHLGLAWSGMDV